MRVFALMLLAACGTDDDPPADPVAVRWISIFASDYDLELEPDFDAEITQYTALADGPDIVVHAEVVLTADADGVSVNGGPAAPSGFRTWLSPPDAGFVSPTSLTVEVVTSDGSAQPVYTIAVTVP